MKQILCNSIIILLLSLSGSILIAQDTDYIDSLKNELPGTKDTIRAMLYFDIAIAYRYRSEDSLCLYAQKMLNVAQNHKQFYAYTLAMNTKGVCFNAKAEYDSALFYYEYGLETSREKNDIREEARSLNNISATYYNKGNYETSLEYALESVRISEEFNINPRVLGANYWNIGNLVYEMGDLRESAEYYIKAKTIFEELGMEHYVMDLENLRALNYKNIDSLDVAIDLFKKCESYHREKNQITELSSVLDNLSMCYMLQEKWSDAEDVLLEALPLANKSGDKSLVGDIYQRLTMLYTDTKRGDLAVKFGELSLKNSTEFNIEDKIYTDHEYLSFAYELQGNSNAALKEFRKFYSIKDSINVANQKENMQNLKIQYETEKKEQEIILLEEKAKRDSLERKGLIGGIILLFSLFTALFYAMRQRMKSNKLAKEKVDQELTFSKRELELNQEVLERKKKELTTFALQLAQKNEVLDEIKNNVQLASKEKENRRALQQIVNRIDFSESDNEYWEGFRTRFSEIHIDFESNVKEAYPTVSTNELRLMSLLKMKLSSKEIANILNVSNDGIKKARYRLRKKLNLETSASLEDLILNL